MNFLSLVTAKLIGFAEKPVEVVEVVLAKQPAKRSLNPIYPFKSSFGQTIAAIFVLAVSILTPTLLASAEELNVLTFESNLIGEIRLKNNPSNLEILHAYYEQLPPSNRELLLQALESMDTLLANYKIAFTAADSAELTQIIADMNMQWIKIQDIHRGAFTNRVCRLLDEVYSALYSL